MIFGPVILQLGIESEGARSSRAEVVGNMFVAMFAAHFAASLFIPWTPREAIRPFLPLLAVFFIVTLFLGGGSWIGKILVIIFAPLAGLPGYLVCLWRHSRFPACSAAATATCSESLWMRGGCTKRSSRRLSTAGRSTFTTRTSRCGRSEVIISTRFTSPQLMERQAG
jgi:hypothetical protein